MEFFNKNIDSGQWDLDIRAAERNNSLKSLQTRAAEETTKTIEAFKTLDSSWDIKDIKKFGNNLY